MDRNVRTYEGLDAVIEESDGGSCDEGEAAIDSNELGSVTLLGEGPGGDDDWTCGDVADISGSGWHRTFNSDNKSAASIGSNKAAR